MPGIKVEEAKKELEGIVAKATSEEQEAKEAKMTAEEKAQAEKTKQEAEAKRVEAETQAKKDAELLLKKDEEITDEKEKQRKVELVEKQKKDEEAKLSSDDRIKRIKEESQKRIDEISNRLKQVEDKSSKEAETLRKELELERKSKAELEKKIAPAKQDDIAAIVKKEEGERCAKYLQEDVSKPREERREMPKEELDDWFLEDQAEATAWVQRRELRRAIEKHQNLNAKQVEVKTKVLMEKQIGSFQRLLIKHPELDVKARKDALKAEGKSVMEIEDILSKENPKYKLSMEIADRHPEWKTEENAPELLAAEIEKELGKQPDKKGDEEISTLKKQIEDLTAKVEELTNPPEEGIGSNLIRKREVEQQASEGEKILIETMRDAKAPQSAIDEAVKDYRVRLKARR